MRNTKFSVPPPKWVKWPKWPPAQIFVSVKASKMVYGQAATMIRVPNRSVKTIFKSYSQFTHLTACFFGHFLKLSFGVATEAPKRGKNDQTGHLLRFLCP